MSRFTVGSLFSGIGGLDLGLERAGMRVVFQVEIDDYANQVLAKHWPDVPRFRDVRTVGRHNLPWVDALVGGFPCQDISYAGDGAGLAGPRSGLWHQFARLISELRPRYIFVENVAALLTRGLGDILGTLASFGYDAEWHCIPACVVGAPHIRDRIWLVAYPQSNGCGSGWPRRLVGNGADRQDEPTPLLADPNSYRRGTPRTGPAQNGTAIQSESGSQSAVVADANGTLSPEPRSAWTGWAEPDHQRLFSSRPAHSDHWAVEPPVGRVAHGVPRRVDRLRGLGNAVVPQVAEYVGRLIMAHANQEIAA